MNSFGGAIGDFGSSRNDGIMGQRSVIMEDILIYDIGNLLLFIDLTDKHEQYHQKIIETEFWISS